MAFSQSTIGENLREAAAAQPQENTSNEAPTPETAQQPLESSTPAAETASTTVVTEAGQLENANSVQDGDVVTEAEPDLSTFSLDLEEKPAQATTESTAQTTSQPAQVSWKEAIKAVDIKEIATELGLDPFVLELNNHLKNGGKAIDYLNAKAVDYTQFSHEALLMDELRKTYPTMPHDKLQRLFVSKYNQGEFADDDAKELGSIQMEADAEILRQKRIAEQQSFKIPEPVTNLQKQEADAEQLRLQQAEQARMDAEMRFVNEHPATQSLLTGKRVSINVGENVPAFNVSVADPTQITNLFYNGDEWQKAITNDKGEPNVELMNQLAVVAKSKGQIFKHLVEYGKALGKKAIIDEGKNAKIPNGQPPLQTNNSTPVYKNGSIGALMGR